MMKVWKYGEGWTEIAQETLNVEVSKAIKTRPVEQAWFEQYKKDAQESNIVKVGDVFYESWGYDQTNIDLMKVVEVSPSGKTVLCRMMNKNRADGGCKTGDMVCPDETFGIVFRMHVRQYNDHVSLAGSYPFCQNVWPCCKIPESKTGGCFNCLKLRFEDTDQMRFWMGTSKREFCKDCVNFYDQPEQSYRSGSARRYDHPLYETDSMFGH